MKCQRCGAENRQTSKFCTTCGTPINDKTPQNIEEIVPPAAVISEPEHTTTDAPVAVQASGEDKKKKKMSKGKKVLISVAAAGGLVVAIAVGGVVYYFKSPAKAIVSDIENNDLDKINGQYKNVQDNKVQKWLLERMLTDTVSEIRDDFSLDKIDFDTYLAQNEVILSFEFDDLSETIKKNFETLFNKYIDDYVAEEIDYEDAAKRVQAMINAGVVSNKDGAASARLTQITALRNSRKAFADGENWYEAQNYAQAYEAYNQVISDDKNYAVAQKRIAECQANIKEAAISDVKAAMNTGDYPKAIRLAKQALSEYVEDTELEKLLKQSQDDYNQMVTEKVEACLSEENYSAAEKMLQEALAVLPGDATLTALSDSVRASKPINLCDMKVSESSNVEQITSLVVTEDVVGNKYNPGNLFTISSSDGGWSDDSNGYMKVYLNGAYQKLKGTLAVADSSETGDCCLTIYGDDRILYTTDTINRTTAPLSVDIDVSNIEWIQIQLVLEGDANMTVLISNFTFYK